MLYFLLVSLYDLMQKKILLLLFNKLLLNLCLPGYSMLKMKCGDDEQCSKSKIQRISTKQAQNKHGALQKLKIGSGTMKE